MADFHGSNFVAGALRTSTRTYSVISPVDSTELPGAFSIASLDDVDLVMNEARKAFEIFALSDHELRASFLETIADEILNAGEDLIERASAETALPVARLTAERARTVGQLRLFATMARDATWVDARIDTGQPEREPIPRPDIRRMKQPIGPVVVFGSSNFPLAFSVAGGDTASAFCTGNPVVVKAHRAHPGTSELIASAIRRAVTACDLPPGVFSMIHGEGRSIGQALVKHTETQAVGFTGSYAAGRALCDAAAARTRPIPVFAEMSSLNPLFLLPDALSTHCSDIAKGLVASVTLGVGQFCTKPGLVFATEGPTLDAFLASVSKALAEITPSSMLTRGILQSYESSRDTIAGDTSTMVVGASSAGHDPSKTQAGASIMMTDAETFLARPHLAEEVFGPFSLIIKAQSTAQFEAIAQQLNGQLTATVHGTEKDLEEARNLLHILSHKAGRLILNGFPTGVEVCHAMQHGGPWPASSDSRFTSVGSAALERFIRPVCYQGFSQELLPPALQDGNPLGMNRMVDGVVGHH